MVFHRILDLETGQDFHPALFILIKTPALGYTLNYSSTFRSSLYQLNKKILFLTSKFKKSLYIRFFIG